MRQGNHGDRIEASYDTEGTGGDTIASAEPGQVATGTVWSTAASAARRENQGKGVEKLPAGELQMRQDPHVSGETSPARIA